MYPINLASSRLFAGYTPIVIHGYSDLLIGAQIPLRRLDRGVPEQELDLLQIAAILAAELGAGPSLMPHAAWYRAFLARRRGYK